MLIKKHFGSVYHIDHPFIFTLYKNFKNLLRC